MYRFLSIKWVHTDTLNKKLTRDWGGGGWGEKLYKVTNITFTTHIHALGFVTASLNLPYQ